MKVTAISVQNITKTYKLYSKHTDRLKELFCHKTLHQKKVVLDGISFDLSQGKVLGVLGLNGSGKSTLLKLLAGLSKPTSGAIHIEGKVVALIELGAGFHPDLTGRENIYLCGIFYGMSRKEVKSKLDSIIAFAGIDEYLDQPVKFYSSGMYLRLAFSLAIHAEPDIFLIDEIFAVGDINFQFKCFQAMRKIKAQNKTIVFISHDLNAINRICDEALIIQNGKIIERGFPSDICNTYHALSHAFLARTKDIEVMVSENGKQVYSGTQDVLLESIFIMNSHQEKVTAVKFNERITVRCHFKLLKSLHPQSMVGLIIKDYYGVEIFSINSYDEGISLENLVDQKKVVVDFSFQASLNPGYFNITVGWAYNHYEPLYNLYLDQALLFEVLAPPPPRRGLPGLCYFPAQISFPNKEKLILQ